LKGEKEKEKVMKRRMYVYEFQVWAILLALNFFGILDSATTWSYMRLSGNPSRSQRRIHGPRR